MRRNGWCWRYNPSPRALSRLRSVAGTRSVLAALASRRRPPAIRLPVPIIPQKIEDAPRFTTISPRMTQDQSGIESMEGSGRSSCTSFLALSPPALLLPER